MTRPAGRNHVTMWGNTARWNQMIQYRSMGPCFPFQAPAIVFPRFMFSKPRYFGKALFSWAVPKLKSRFFSEPWISRSHTRSKQPAKLPKTWDNWDNQKVWRTIEFVAIQAGSCSCKFCNHSRRWQSSQVDRSWKIGLWQSRLAAFGLTSMVYFTRSANW